MRWFDSTIKDLIWKHVIWFGFDLNLSWFDLWFEEITIFCGLSDIIVKWIGYGPVNNRFFMDILPKYVASFFGNSEACFQPVAPSSDQGRLGWRLFLCFSLILVFFHINFALKSYGYYFLL